MPPLKPFSFTAVVGCWIMLQDLWNISMTRLQTAASTEPQQLNSNATSWPRVLLTPAGCGWPAGGGGNELKQGWTLAL